MAKHKTSGAQRAITGKFAAKKAGVLRPGKLTTKGGLES
jgi:hypothetical protein